MEPSTIPGPHLLSIDLLTLPSFKCDLIEEMEVKQIIPSDEAIAICIA